MRNVYVYVVKAGHLTSLKLSKAEMMMSCPPLTRHTAANSSSTRALVLWMVYLNVLQTHTINTQTPTPHKKKKKHSPGGFVVEAECNFIYTSGVSHD